MPSADGGKRAQVCAVQLGSKYVGCGVQFHKPWKYPRGGQYGNRCRRICNDIYQHIRRKKKAQAEKERNRYPADHPELSSLPPTSLSDTHVQSNAIARVPARSASFNGRSLPGIRKSILKETRKAGPKRNVAFRATEDENEMAQEDNDGPTTSTGIGPRSSDDPTSDENGREGPLKRLKNSIKNRRRSRQQKNGASGSTERDESASTEQEEEGEASGLCRLM